VLITTNTTHAANEHLYKKLPYDPVKDFVPVTGLGKGGQVLVVRADSPYKSVADILAKAKKDPGKLSFGSGSSSSRVAGELFKQLSGTDILHVPYKSNPNALTDLLGGQIDMMITDTATGLPQIKGGKLRALGVSGTKRIALLPDVPTIAEAGVKGYDMGYWFAAYVPAKTPPRRRSPARAARRRNEERDREVVLREHRHRRVDDGELRRAGAVPGRRSAEVGARHQGRRHRARVIVHLVDGTYELFRHFYGLRRFTKGKDRPLGAVVGVLQSVLEIVERARRTSASPPTTSSSRSATSSGRATRRRPGSSRRSSPSSIRSRTRSRRWASSSGRWSSSRPTMRSPRRAHSPTPTARRQGLHLDARQGPRAVRPRRPRRPGRPARQGDPRRRRRAREVRRRAGADPRLPRARRRRRRRLPGIDGIGAVGAARLLTRHGAIEAFPPALLGDRLPLALLFKRLATLRTDAALFKRAEALRWRGPTPAFAAWTERADAPRLLERCLKASAAVA
jgi:hypothetical protein